jgi:hypothetical protein
MSDEWQKLNTTYWFTLFMHRCIPVIVFDGETKTSWVNVPVAPEKESTKDRLCEEVENTIENRLTVRGDDVASEIST